MKTEELQTVRICCKVTPEILNQIDRLARKKGISHQQVVSDLVSAQLEGTNGIAKENQLNMSRLYRCRAILAEMEQELNRVINVANFRNS